MIAFIVFLILVASVGLALFVGPVLKQNAEHYPPVDNDWLADRPHKYATKDDQIYVVSSTISEADKWRRENGWHRDNIYWVSGASGLSLVRESLIVFTGQWQDRPDATELWAQAHAGTDNTIMVDSEPEATVQEDSIDSLFEE